MYYLLLICDLLFFRLITELVCQRTRRGRARLMYNEMGKLSPSSPCLICDFSTFCNVYSLREMFVCISYLL